jgi:hypothetical protein
MNYRRYLHPGLALVAIGVSVPLALAAQTLPSREDNQGQVTVTVTPLTNSNAEGWRFDVQLNTHVAPLTQDMTAVSVLSDGRDHDEKPLSWQGDPPGGHHRKGVLTFKPFSSAPETLTLKIRQVGSVPERTFTWKLGAQ